jgi:hypothetical protein
MMNSRLRALLREPLLHFALAGALLFAAYDYYGPPAAAPASRDIVVTDAQVDALRAQLREINRQPPTDEELERAVHDYVDEEVLYREAVALGLDAGDLVVRRRLEQKMRFLIEDTTRLAPATDADLTAYLDAHRADFDAPARIRLTHVFVSRDAHGPETDTTAAALHARLLAESVPPEKAPALGDSFPAGADLDDMTERELVRYLGADFAAAVMRLPVGSWSEPIASIHGEHLVWIREQTPARAVTLDEVRARVLYAFDRERHDAANEERLAALRARYNISLPILDGAQATAGRR